MSEGSTAGRARKWHDSAHASLCVLGSYLRQIGFFRPLAEGIKLRQKVLKYTPVQKVEMLFVALLAGAKAVSHTGLTLRVDPALQAAFGLPGCADQSVIADTLDAATEQDVAAVRAAVETLFRQHSHTLRHDLATAVLTLDVDLSPLPASRRSEGSTRGGHGPQPLQDRAQAGARAGGPVPGDRLGRRAGGASRGELARRPGGR
jgi:hypothetical protein